MRLNNWKCERFCVDIPTLDNSVVSVLAFEWSNRKAFPTIDHMIVTGFHGRGRDHLSAVQTGGGGEVRGQHCAVENFLRKIKITLGLIEKLET